MGSSRRMSSSDRLTTWWHRGSNFLLPPLHPNHPAPGENVLSPNQALAPATPWLRRRTHHATSVEVESVAELSLLVPTTAAPRNALDRKARPSSLGRSLRSWHSRGRGFDSVPSCHSRTSHSPRRRVDGSLSVMYLLARGTPELVSTGDQSMGGPTMQRFDFTRLVLTLALLVAVGASRPATVRGDDQSLEKLVAPIALYPDPLVAQILPASTNPLEVFEAADAVANGTRPSQETASKWDPSIQALLSFPSVLKMMRDKVDWTTQLGKAFVADQGGVLAAIQSVRQQVQKAGNLKSTTQQVVTTQGTTIIIEPASPQVIYVPQYDPVAVLAPAPYYAYAPMMTFGVGFAAGAATAYACSWGSSSSVVVNNNYHYSYTNTYDSYHSYSSSSGSYGTYHPQNGTYTGYDAKTGTYGAYNPATGKYGTYNPSTGAYNKDGQTGTYHGAGSTGTSYGSTSSGGYHESGSTGSSYRGSSSSSAWGDHSSWGSGAGSGGDAFHGVGGGGWGAQEASSRGNDSLG